MHLDLAPHTGSLYRVGPDWQPVPQLGQLTISNGLAWTADSQTCYFIDTATRVIMAFDFAAATGHLSNPRAVIEVPEAWGGPDGMCIDQEGKLWVAHWGGHCVRRWDPVHGEVLATIELPVPHVTSCAFGGQNYRQLFITTARSGMDEVALARHPQSGGLFVCKLPVGGFPPTAFHA
jgi:sugar lactone lactonase YvrE